MLEGVEGDVIAGENADGEKTPEDVVGVASEEKEEELPLPVCCSRNCFRLSLKLPGPKAERQNVSRFF